MFFEIKSIVYIKSWIYYGGLNCSYEIQTMYYTGLGYTLLYIRWAIIKYTEKITLYIVQYMQILFEFQK